MPFIIAPSASLRPIIIDNIPRNKSPNKPFDTGGAIELGTLNPK